MPHLSLLRFIVLGCLFAGCAHSTLANAISGLKPTAESFFERARWRDFQGAKELLVPEKRDAFSAARIRLRDDRDLSIADYEMLEARLEPDGKRAVVVTRMSWARLPSLTENSETVVSEFVAVGAQWLLARQTGGPFQPELGAPYQAK
jgi:hypothetical protein